MKRPHPVPWPWLRVLIPLLLAWLPHAKTQAGTDTPLPLDSPAWRELMNQPVLQDETLAYHAAMLAGAWGRTAEKIALLNALLLLHGQTLAGQALPATLGELLGRATAHPQALQAAWDAGLNQAWSAPVWDGEAPPAASAPGATPWPGRPGFWRLPGGRLAARPRVENRSPVVIALQGPLQLLLQGSGSALALDCTLQQGTPRLRPGERARWWCVSRGAVPADALAAEPQLLWNTPLPLMQADVDRWIDLLAGRRPLALTGLDSLYADCQRWPDCRRGARTGAAEPSAWDRFHRAIRGDEDRRANQRDLKQRAARRWYLAALVVAGFGAYAFVARHFGTASATVLSSALVMAGAGWLSTQGGGGGWYALAVAGAVVMVLVYGAMLTFVYRWLYRVLFGHPETS